MQSHIEAMRALVVYNAAAIDFTRALEGDEAELWDEIAELLTPVTKAWCTDVGMEVTSTAVQVFGGMGYIEESGVSQHFRDMRIAPIYEGTNGIQAMDLVGRKLPLRMGGVVGDAPATASGTWTPSWPPPATSSPSIRANLSAAVRVAVGGHGLDHDQRPRRPEVEALAGATPYLRDVRHRHRRLAAGPPGAGRPGRARRRLRATRPTCRPRSPTARFFAEQHLPQVAGLVGAVTAGPDDLYEVDATSLASV